MANNCKKGTGTFRSTMIPYSFMASCIVAYLLIFNLDAFAVDAFTPPKLHSTRYARSEIDNPSNYKRIYLVERYMRFSATTDKASLSTEVDPSSKSSPSPERMKKRRIPKIIMNVYINYITKLWRQTEPKEREKIAAQQALSAIKRVKHIMEGEEYVDMSDVNEGESLDEIDERIVARDELLLACNHMLHCLEKVDIPAPAMEIDAEKVKMAAEAVNSSNQKSVEPKKKKSRSVLFGAAMGAMVACWVFSGNVLFASFFTLMTALGQLEYYRMIMKTGIYPARRISVLGACSMFMTVSLPENIERERFENLSHRLSWKIFQGSVCSQPTSDLSSGLRNICHDLVPDDEEKGQHNFGNRNNIYWNVLFRLYPIILGSDTADRKWYGTNSTCAYSWPYFGGIGSKSNFLTDFLA